MPEQREPDLGSLGRSSFHISVARFSSLQTNRTPLEEESRDREEMAIDLDDLRVMGSEPRA